MNQPTNQEGGAAGPWMLLIGLALGAGLLAFMAWDGMSHSGGNTRHSELVVEITEADWEKEVLDSKIPVVVDFSAEWCGPCHRFAPTLDSIAERYKGKAKVCRLDVGDQSFNKARNLQQQYGFNGIPQILIFKGGELRKQFQGITPERDLARSIDGMLN